MPQHPRKNLENRYEYYGEVTKRWAQNNPEKISAQRRVQYAVKTGKIKKQKICFLCKNEKQTIGHHLNYNHPLFVIWLCVSCHRKYHEKMKRKAAS